MLIDYITRLSDLVEKISAAITLHKIKIIVPVGKRLDLASVVQSKLAIEFASKMSTFLVQLTHGSVQRKSKLPGYMLLVQANDDCVPVTIPALNLRAKRSEQCRLRCMSADCPLRPPEELESLLAMVGGGVDALAADAGAFGAICSPELAHQESLARSPHSGERTIAFLVIELR